MSKVKVQLRVKTIGAKAGDVIEVEKDDAEALIRNGNAIGVSKAAKEFEAEAASTPEAGKG